MTAPNETPDLERLGELARSRGLRVSVAESLTSGRLANTIGAGEGASGWFAGGIVAYFTEVKERVLGLTPGTDPTSAACAEQLEKQTASKERLLSVTEAATWANVHPETIRRAIKARRLRAVTTLGRHPRIRPADLERMVAGGAA